MAAILIIEEVSTFTEEYLVVDEKTGELLCQYLRNTRKINQLQKQRMKQERRRALRKLTSIQDVRSTEDINTLLGPHDFYSPIIPEQAIELLDQAKISPRAVRLLHNLTLKVLHAQNYAVVTNATLQELCDDQSRNYNNYVKQLQDGGFIKVSRISKTEKRIALNPIYGFRGNQKLRDLAIRRWYSPSRISYSTEPESVENYENESLQAA